MALTNLVVFLSILLISGTHQATAAPPTAVAAPPAPVAPTIFGMNLDDPAPKRQHFERVAEAKFQWVRLWFWWKWLESERGQINWSVMDAQVAWAKQKGFRIYGSFTSIPHWVNGSPSQCNFWNDKEAAICNRPWPSNSTAYVDFVTKVVRRYKNEIEIWSVWNEPNLKTFWGGTIPEYLGLILGPAARVIKEEAPTAKVAGPELASLGSSWWADKMGKTNEVDWRRWLREILQYRDPTSGRSPLDLLSQHSYESSAQAVGQTLDAIRSLAVQNQGGGLPIWLTETAFNDCKLGAKRQLEEMRRLIEMVKSKTRAEFWAAVFYHGISENDAAIKSGQCGALTQEKPSFPPKPISNLFSQMLPGSTPNIEYSALTAAEAQDFQRRLRQLAIQDGWSGQNAGPRLNYHGWNFYLNRMTGERGVDLGAVLQNVPGLQVSAELTVEEWFRSIRDFVR